MDWEKVKQEMQREAQRAPVARSILEGKGFSRLEAIREFYRMAREDIKAAGPAEWGIDPYEVDWIRLFTPIEFALWHDIRNANAVLYPQYPVGRYFVDFGNPVAKVAIECDGAKWHQDAGKDFARQLEIEEMGWRVYRITGRDCKTDFDDETLEKSAARKLIDRVVQNHGIGRK